MIKRLLVIFAVSTIPLFLFLNAWQSFRYNDLADEVRQLEKKQEELVEKNKSLIVGIEIFRSPKRIDRIAVKELGLHLASTNKIMKIKERSEIR